MTMCLKSSSMRRLIYIVLALCLSAFLASCEKGTYIVREGQPIYLSVSLPYTVETKVPFEASAPTTSNPLNVDVWASTKPAEYKDEGKDGSQGEVAIHTHGHFQSAEPQLLSQAIYPTPKTVDGKLTADPVYFVSMYPQGWSNPDNSQGQKDANAATRTFTGCEDLMFAPQVFGAYDLEDQGLVVNASPVLKFEHLLTRITVKIGAELEEGESIQDLRDAWGNIMGLKIQSYNKAGDYVEIMNKVTLDLSEGDEFSYDTDVTFAGQKEGSMGFFEIDTDKSFPESEAGYVLTQKLESVAYVMCAPVIAAEDSHEYVITVTTENRGEHELKMDIQKTAGSEAGLGTTRGNHFNVTLKFKKGRTIATSVEVAEWKNGGYGLGNLED